MNGRACLHAALVYFALVMATGFVLGVVRVSFLVPRIGERWAELSEMPFMGTVIYLAAGRVLRRFPPIRAVVPSVVVGGLALLLAVCAEVGLAVALQNQTLGDYVRGRDRVSGSVYLVMLLAFALMPWLRLRGHASHQRRVGES